MGGDTGGNDCVHVIDLQADPDGTLPDFVIGLRDDTDVIIHDEHGNLCQFTYQGWDAFALRVKRGEFDQVCGEYAQEEVAKHDAQMYAVGVDPSAAVRLDALPDVSVTFSGTFDAAESGEKIVVLGTFIPHTASATGTPEHLRAVADELERRDGNATESMCACPQCAQSSAPLDQPCTVAAAHDPRVTSDGPCDGSEIKL